MKSFAVIVGTRPEAVKLAPLVLALRAEAEVIIISTRQHAELAETSLAEFGLHSDVRLEAPPSPRSLAELSAWMLPRLDAALSQVKVEGAIVQGDTTTAFVGGLAAHYCQLPVAHVEAGLRTGRLDQPFPEEANRRMLAAITKYHFASTASARANLLREGVEPSAIWLVGNTVVDAVALGLEHANKTGAGRDLPQGPLIFVTCHRRENLGPALDEIAFALRDLSLAYSKYNWVVVLHPNPKAQSALRQQLAGLDNVRLVAPLSHAETLVALSRSHLVLTDSGGLQEEAATLACPVLILRDRTERPEGLAAGFATIAGRSRAGIVAAAKQWFDDDRHRLALSGKPNPYGDGQSSRRITEVLLAAGPS